MEATATESFLKGSRLRQLLASPECPPALQSCRDLFHKHFGHDFSGSVNDDDDSLVRGNPVVLPSCLRKATGKRMGTMCARIKYKGRLLTTHACHKGNSLVLFGLNGRPKDMKESVPGCIQYICIVDGSVKLAVRQYLPCTSIVGQDPFARYYDFPAKLSSSDLDTTLIVIPMKYVGCHFAQYIISDKMVVLALSDFV